MTCGKALTEEKVREIVTDVVTQAVDAILKGLEFYATKEDVENSKKAVISEIKTEIKKNNG